MDAEVDAVGAAEVVIGVGTDSLDGSIERSRLGTTGRTSFCGGSADSGWGGFHRGHFFAVSESSGTSSISLQCTENKFQMIYREVKMTYITSSPAKRNRFSILTMRGAGVAESGLGESRADTEAWKSAHNDCRVLKLCLNITVKHWMNTGTLTLHHY